MKRSWLLYLVILVLTVFSSCSSTLYKHRLMLESCHTGDDVLRRLGLPDEKIYTKTAEEWVYNLDRVYPDIIPFYAHFFSQRGVR